MLACNFNIRPGCFFSPIVHTKFWGTKVFSTEERKSANNCHTELASEALRNQNLRKNKILHTKRFQAKGANFNNNAVNTIPSIYFERFGVRLKSQSQG